MAMTVTDGSPRVPLSGNPAAGNEQEARSYRREFFIFCVTFSLNHATVTTPILFASTVLTNEAGQGSNAMLYGATLVTTLFFATFLFSILGPKKGLGIAMGLYSIYVLSFAYAASLCTDKNGKGQCIEAHALQVPVAFGGAFIGGVGAGLLWTCQGAFNNMLCEKLAVAENRPTADVTAESWGTWGLIFLACESAVRALTTVFTKYAHLKAATAFYIWAGVAVLATVTFLVFASNFKSSNEGARVSILAKLLSAVKLWREPSLWLLQCTNIAFGFAASWLGGYVGRNILTKALGADFIGFAGALLSGLAAILSKVFGYSSQKIGKGPIVCLGSVAFLCLGIFSKWVGPTNAADWGWGALIFYVFMGIGRSVYESTNKAVFSDFFPGEKAPGAFANVFVFNSGSSTVAFILGAKGVDEPELYLLLVFAALIIPGFLSASALKMRANRVATREVVQQP